MLKKKKNCNTRQNLPGHNAGIHQGDGEIRFEWQNISKLHGGDEFRTWEISSKYIPSSPSPSQGEVEEEHIERVEHSRKRKSIHVKKKLTKRCIGKGTACSRTMEGEGGRSVSSGLKRSTMLSHKGRCTASKGVWTVPHCWQRSNWHFK